MTNLSKMAIAIAVCGTLVGTGVSAQNASDRTNERYDLAADLLSAGEKTAAVTRLEQERETAPRDPAVLINLGIAHARLGNEDKARAAFEQALVSPDPVEVETADGRTLDSRRLARMALQMLDRGEFRATLASRR